MVPKRGLEPPLPDGNYTLNVARLPIPPLRHVYCNSHFCNRARTVSCIAPVAIFHLAIQPRRCQARLAYEAQGHGPGRGERLCVRSEALECAQLAAAFSGGSSLPALVQPWCLGRSGQALFTGGTPVE